MQQAAKILEYGLLAWFGLLALVLALRMLRRNITVSGMLMAEARGKGMAPENVLNMAAFPIVLIYFVQAGLHVDVAVETTTQNGEDKQEFHTQCNYDLERPNHFALHTRHVKDKEAGLDFVSDGKTLLVHAMRFKQYTESPAPKGFADLGQALAKYNRTNTGFFVPNLLTDDIYESLIEDVISCAYAGKDKLGDVEAHHVKVVHQEIKWEMWIAAEDKPLVLKAVTLVAVDEFRAAGVESYKNWKVDELPAKTAFSITPPPDASKVDVIGPPKPKK